MPPTRAYSVGLVVTPESTPQLAASSISAMSAVSRKNFTLSFLQPSSVVPGIRRYSVSSAAGHDVLENLGHRTVELVAVDHRYVVLLRKILDVAPEQPDVREVVAVARERPIPVGLRFSDVEVAQVGFLVVHADDKLDHPRGAELSGVKVARDDVDALHHHRHALEHPALDQRVDSGADDGRLLAKADDHGIGALRRRNSQTAPRVERALMNRGHEVPGEYTTHDLSDGIRRGNAVDSEPVGDLGGDRGLAHTGRAADENDERPIMARGIAQFPVARRVALPCRALQVLHRDRAHPLEETLVSPCSRNSSSIDWAICQAFAGTSPVAVND